MTSRKNDSNNKLSRMAFSRMVLARMTLGKVAIGRMTFSRMIYLLICFFGLAIDLPSVIQLCVILPNVSSYLAFGVSGQDFTECHETECRGTLSIGRIILENVFKLSFYLLDHRIVERERKREIAWKVDNRHERD
jgi:hypothetical protein